MQLLLRYHDAWWRKSTKQARHQMMHQVRSAKTNLTPQARYLQHPGADAMGLELLHQQWMLGQKIFQDMHQAHVQQPLGLLLLLLVTKSSLDFWVLHAQTTFIAWSMAGLIAFISHENMLRFWGRSAYRLSNAQVNYENHLILWILQSRNLDWSQRSARSNACEANLTFWLLCIQSHHGIQGYLQAHDYENWTSCLENLEKHSLRYEKNLLWGIHMLIYLCFAFVILNWIGDLLKPLQGFEMEWGT